MKARTIVRAFLLLYKMRLITIITASILFACSVESLEPDIWVEFEDKEGNPRSSDTISIDDNALQISMSMIDDYGRPYQETREFQIMGNIGFPDKPFRFILLEDKEDESRGYITITIVNDWVIKFGVQDAYMSSDYFESIESLAEEMDKPQYIYNDHGREKLTRGEYPSAPEDYQEIRFWAMAAVMSNACSFYKCSNPKFLGKLNQTDTTLSMKDSLGPLLPSFFD